MNVLTEFHQGNYIFYDTQQLSIGSCTKEEISCRVAVRIIGHKPADNTILTECGFLALGYDGLMTNPEDFASFQDYLNLKTGYDKGISIKFIEPYYHSSQDFAQWITKMSQEIGIVTTKSDNKIDYARFPIGSPLFIYPWHSCATACQHTTFYVHSGDKIVDTWTPKKGW